MASMEDFAMEELERTHLSRFHEEFLHGTIHDLSPAPFLSVDVKATVGDAVTEMKKNNTGCICIVEDGKLVGIFTERDLLIKVVGVIDDWSGRSVADHMTRDPETLNLVDQMGFCLHKMAVGGFRHVPVVDDDGKPVGIVSVRQMVKFIVELFPETINVSPHPGVALPRSSEPSA